MPLYHGAEFQSCWAPIRGSLLFTLSSRWTMRCLCVFFRLGAFPSKSALAGFAFFVKQTQNLQTEAKEHDKKKQRKGNRSKIVKSVSMSPHTLLGKITQGFKRVVNVSMLFYTGIISAKLCTPMMCIWSYIEVISCCQRMR